MEIQKLILGRGVAGSYDIDGSPGRLDELTGLSKLRTLKVLNERLPKYSWPLMVLNHNLLLHASKLKSLQVYVLSTDIVALTKALSYFDSLHEIQIRSISDYKDPKNEGYHPSAGIGDGWRKILLGSDLFDGCPEHIYIELFETVLSISKDIQEIGLPYIRWVSLLFSFLIPLLMQTPGYCRTAARKLSRAPSIDVWIPYTQL